MTIKKQREVNLRDIYAEVAQLVERNLAKVDVASSRLVSRSRIIKISRPHLVGLFFTGW